MAALSYADLFSVPPGAMQYQTVTNQGAANALNAQGARLISYTPGAREGEGTWLMGFPGQSQAGVQANLLNYAIGQYNEGKAAEQKQYADVMSTIDTLGGTQREILKRQYEAAQGQVAQGIAGRNLQNSSIAANMQRGVNQDYAFAQMALEDQLQRQRLDYMASRNISYPSLDYLGALALQSAQMSPASPTSASSPQATPNATAVTKSFSRLGSGG